ncbi:MAG: hypothetical protein QOG75_3167 [Mycobacterium sp.]|nr:hypothetical protein [Mycobacterium sp.]
MNHDTDDEPGRSSGPGDDVIEVEHPEKQPRGHAIWSPQSSVLEMPSCRHGVAAVKRSSPEVLKFCLSEVEPLDRLMRSLVMNAAIDLGQRSTAATPSARDDLRDDRYRGLLRCTAAEVQADRARQPA